MARVEVDRTWLARNVSAGLDAAVVRVLHDHGMTANPGPEGLEMRGGSQAKMRFLGGAMTKDSILPRRGVLKRSPESGQVDVERIALHLEDRMGFGLMDPGMRKKYDRILGAAHWKRGHRAASHFGRSSISI